MKTPFLSDKTKVAIKYLMLAFFLTITAPKQTAQAYELSHSALISKKITNSEQKITINKNLNEIIVKYKKNKVNLNTVAGRTMVENNIRNKSLVIKTHLKKNNISVLKIPDGQTMEQKIAELKNDLNVEYVEPNYRRYPTSISTNDTYRDRLWALDNTGQTVNGTSGTSDADIDAPTAWTTLENAINTSTAIVAVIDTGVAYNHPDLTDNMWDGTGCVDENGAALGNCIHGYDYQDDDKNPLPTESSHGTHVAGTIAAVKNNSQGTIGVAPQAKIMALKFDMSISSEIQAINFAIQNGAKIINASFAGTDYSVAEYEAINEFKNAGGIFVAAAGNESNDNESTHTYPSDYNLDNIISVAATDQNDSLAWFSNYGNTSVDVGAPGTNIYSAIANSVTFSEAFGSVTTPNLPVGWSTTGTNNNWGTYNLESNKVLYSDTANPYANSASSTATSPTIDMSDAATKGATLNFHTQCDTEYTADSWSDYLQLEYSADGTNFTPASDPFYGGNFRWDEAYLDLLNGDDSPTGTASYDFSNVSIPSAYLTSNFKFRFHWITNSSDNNYDACNIDNIVINKYTDGSDEQYGYKDGTSMATPHVAGLAALIWAYNNSLSYGQLKNAILNSGDSLSSLNGKTLSGKRINANAALEYVANSNLSISGTITFFTSSTLPVRTATVTLYDDLGNLLSTTTTDSNGYYFFNGLASHNNYVVSTTKNDLKRGVSITDVTLAARRVANLVSFATDTYKMMAADANWSGTVNITDVAKISRLVANLDTVMTAGSWKFFPSDVASTLTTSTYRTASNTKSLNDLSAPITVDFWGVKMGDVNGSWTN